MKNNLYSNLVNFYNVNDENFKEFMAEIYEKMLTTHKDVKYVKEHLTEEIVKILDKYLVDGKFNVNIEEKVNEFLENNQDIKNINLQMNTITQEVEKPITLNKCDEELLSAIQNKEGETTFDLLSIPRDSSVTTQKLSTDIKDTLYNKIGHDDTSILKKGVVGVNNIYMVNHQYENCVIDKVTVQFSQPCEGKIVVLENINGKLIRKKTIDFNTTTLGGLKPTIEVNCKVDKGYIGITRNSSSSTADFGNYNNNYDLLTYSDKTVEKIPLAQCEVFPQFALPFKVEGYEIKVVESKELDNYVKKDELKIGTNSYIIVDKNGDGDYTSIQEALNNYNGIPLFVKNGIYEEGRINCDDKTVVMIGEDKYRTIIKNKNGMYEEDCLYCSNGVFSNLQFISEYVNGESTEIGQQNGAYAVHVDSNNQANGTCVFNDCIIISDFNAAVGGGLRKNNTVEFNNCDLISRQYNRGQDFANGGMGALFVHNNHTGTGDNCPNQIIRLNNCRLKAKLKNVIRIQEISKNNAEAILDINNCLIYSETNGVTGVIKYGNVNSFNQMNIWRLSNTSYGNTVKELNKL